MILFFKLVYKNYYLENWNNENYNLENWNNENYYLENWNNEFCIDQPLFSQNGGSNKRTTQDSIE